MPAKKLAPAAGGSPPRLPEDLVGVMFADNRNFVCKDCIGDDDNIDNEDLATVVLAGDEWFNGEICTRCGNLTERPV